MVCGSNDIARFITAKETILEGYRRDFGGINDLKAKAFDLNEELSKARDSVPDTTIIPAEYLSIADPDAHLKRFRNALIEKNLQANPMQDIAESFMHYLDVISGGKVSTEFPEADKLVMQIYSDNRLLDYGKLSEGTKETIFLAFRLAVLDHLFPDGGGVIVFDDPFTDMDSDRAAQACELINECAKRHQIILLTCSEKYLKMLQGNRVLF